MESVNNAILIQNITLSELERMIDKAVSKRISEFYAQLQEKKSLLVKRKAAAVMLGVSLPTLDLYAKSGILHAKHIGGRVFFDEEELKSINRR